MTRMTRITHGPLTNPGPCCVALALVVTAATLFAAAVPADAGRVTERNGVPCTVNTSTPAHGEQTLPLRELWRFHSEDDADLLVGMVKDVIADPEGNVYLLDAQLAQVHVFSPDGRYLRSLGHQGDGPGESRSPMGVLFPPGGGVGVFEAFPPRVVRVDLEGDPMEPIELRPADMTVGTNRLALTVKARGEVLAYSGRTFSMGGGERKPMNLLATCRPDGTERARILEKESEEPMETGTWVEREEYFVHGDRWTIGPQGNLYLAPEYGAYLIHVYSPTGDLLRVFERDYESRARTPEEMADMGIEMVNNGQEIPIKNVIEDRAPCINGLYVQNNGEVWVAHSLSAHDLTAGILQRYDVFDPQGHYTRAVALDAGFARGDDDRMFLLGNDRAVLIRGFDPSISISIGGGGDDVHVPEEERPPLEVICFAVETGS